MPENCDVIPQELFLVTRDGKPVPSSDRGTEVFLSREDAEALVLKEGDEIVSYCRQIEFNKMRKERDEARSLLASCTDLANSWARESSVAEARTEAEMPQLIDRLRAEWSRRFFAMREERDVFATALLESTATVFAWWIAFEAIDEDNMRPEDHAALSIVYNRKHSPVDEDRAEAVLAARDRRVGSAIAALALRALRRMSRPALYNHQVWDMVAVEDIEFAVRALELEAKK